MINSQKLSLDDLIEITEVEAIKGLVPLDDEQLAKLKEAYNRIEGYKGQTIPIRQIDGALDLVAESKFLSGYGKDYGGEILSLRVIREFDIVRKTFTLNVEQENAPLWVPYNALMIGNKILYLIEANDNQLYFGIDAEPVHIRIHLARIGYGR